jgi:hypothetical protein
MSSTTADSVRDELSQKAMAIGNYVTVNTTGATSSTNALPYIDSSGKLDSGEVPFPVRMSAGITDSSYATMIIKGRSSLSADELYHCNLVVSAATVTTFTTSGYLRVNVTDEGGNITDGYYYVPFGLPT